MYFKNIDEKSAIEFTENILDYYSKIDNGSVNTIYTSNDPESSRNNVGWYRYEDGLHKVNVNIPNILYARRAIEIGMMDNDGFYAFLALCTGHEFRHFRQGRCIYDGIEIDGYGQKDVFNAELMLYVRYFFDAYYLSNKKYVKYEVDAEKFAVENGVKFLQANFPEVNAEKAMTDAVNFYAGIQNQGRFASSTLPVGCESVSEILSELTERLDTNLREPYLLKTLFVHNPKFYSVHERFGLDGDEVVTPELLRDYAATKDGSKQDLMVVERILSQLEKPNESLEDFPQLKKTYFKP